MPGCADHRLLPLPARFAAYHVCVKLVPLDALAKKSLFLHGLHRGALVHAHKAEIIQLTLVNAAPQRKLMVGRYQKHQLILSIRHRLSQAYIHQSEPDQQVWHVLAQDSKQ